MHIAYIAHGFDPDGFWRLAPREVKARCEGARKRLEAESDNRISLAWHTAAFSRQKKLPDLKKILERSNPKKKQTPEEQALALDMLFLAWGGDPKDLAKKRNQTD